MSPEFGFFFMARQTSSGEVVMQCMHHVSEGSTAAELLDAFEHWMLGCGFAVESVRRAIAERGDEIDRDTEAK